jgi:hypothetical protein
MQQEMMKILKTIRLSMTGIETSMYEICGVVYVHSLILSAIKR